MGERSAAGRRPTRSPFGTPQALLTAFLALSLTFTVTSPTVAQDPSRVLSIVDQQGDLVGATGEQEEGPGIVDVTGVTVWVEGHDLVLRLAAAEPYPVVLGPTDPWLSFSIAIRHRGFRAGHKTLTIEHWPRFDPALPSAWRAWLSDAATSLITPLDDPVVIDGSLVVHMPVAAFSRPRRLVFEWGQMMGAKAPDEQDAEASSELWIDRMPDDGMLLPEVARSDLAAALADPPTVDRTIRGLERRDLGGLLTLEPAEGDLTAIQDEFVRYVGSRPATVDLLERFGFPATVFEACDQDLSEGRFTHADAADPGELGPLDFCDYSFGALYLAYAQTGDEEVYGLLARYVGATLARYPEEARGSYLEALASIPRWVEDSSPELFRSERD